MHDQQVELPDSQDVKHALAAFAPSGLIHNQIH